MTQARWRRQKPEIQATPATEIIDEALRSFQAYVDGQLQTMVAINGPTRVTFPGGLTKDQVRHVRRVACQYGFAFGIVGEADDRHATVYVHGAPDAPVSQELNMGMPRDEQMSRKLSAILRHRALELGLDMAPDGWVRVSDILALEFVSGLGFDVAEVEALIRKADRKRRFSLEWWEGDLWIRANQGHTMRAVVDDVLLQPIEIPDDVPCCVHGTYLFAWEQILSSGGLSRMTRNHIHFAPRPPGSSEVISGMRRDCEVAIYVSVPRAMAAGINFYRSSNDVILTPGDDNGLVPTEFFEKAVRLADNTSLWPRPDAQGSPNRTAAGRGQRNLRRRW